MSIKKDNVNVTAVKYNSQDVNKVILDNKCVWCKPFTYTQGTLPTGVASLTCTRSSTDEPTASTGTIANGGTIYYDDKLYWAATASTGYRITAIKGSGSPVTVSGAITGTTASGLISERISGTISQGTLPTGVASIKCYRKAYNGSSFAEYTGTTIYYGDQFYWTATAATGYNNPNLTYNSSSKVYTWNGSQGGSITSVSVSGLSAGTRRSFTISFGTTANKSLYGSWSSSSQTAYYGDKITVSGNSVICYKWDNNSTARWTVKVTASSNNAQYTYSAVTIAESSIASVTAQATFTAYNTRTTNKYTVTFSTTSGQYGSWGTTSISNVPYGTTITRNGNTVTVGNAGSSTFTPASTTVQYNYATPTFSVPSSVTGATTVAGGCVRSDRLYTIQWIGENGSTVLETDSNVKYGAVLTYNGSTPSKTSTDQYSYTFSAWKLGSTSGSTVTSGSTTNAGSTSSTTIKIYSTFTSTVRSYTITWKYLSAYPDTWATATQSYNYGATPSRTSSSTVTNTSNTLRKVFTSWDSLATVTGNRTITANYKTQVNATFSGTRCSAKIDNVAVSNNWYDINKTVTWTANPNCAFSSDGSTTTTTDTISTQKTNYTASADYVNVTKLTGTHCSTTAKTGWKSITDKITWTADTAYAFDTSNTTTSQPIAVVPGENKYTASYVKQYKLTISATNASYGTYSVSRTSSPYQGASTGTLNSGDTIYYGDVLTGTSSAKAVSYDGWSVTSVTAPTFTTTGDATSGNLTITNKSSYQATLYYNTSNAVGGTSAGTATANASKTVSGLSFNTQYYISARVSRTRTKHTYATDGTQYSGTNSVTGNVTATFKFKDTTSTDTGTIDSSVVAAKTAPQNQYTITWKYLSAYPDTWTTATQTYNYGATPSRSNPNTVTSGSARKVFARWDNLNTVTGNRTITAVYVTQFAPTIKSNYCTANRSSGTWYDSGTVITWTANDNYSFGGTAVKDTTTQTITSGGTYSATPGYIKCAISGTRCNALINDGSILKVGDKITYVAKSNYSYTEHATTASNPTYQTVTLGTTSYSRSCDYVYIKVSGTNCNANVADGYRKIGNSITWTANPNYAFDSSGKTTASQTIEESPKDYSKSATYGKYIVNVENCKASASTGWYPVTSSKSTTFIAHDGWSFGGTAVKDTTTASDAVPGSVGASPTYCNITVSIINCRWYIDGVSHSPNLDFSGLVQNGNTITYVAVNANYAFDSSGTSRKTVTINGPGTYSGSASYGECYIRSTNCTANVSTGWYPCDSILTVTWTADTNYAFDSSGKTTDSVADYPPGDYNKAANYVNVTKLTGINCSTNFTTGWKSINDQITWIADAAYAFDSADNTTSETVKVVPGENTYTASYVKHYDIYVTKHNHVSSAKAWRTASPYKQAPISSSESPLINGVNTTQIARIYYGDSLTMEASANQYYHFSGGDNSYTFVSQTISTVTGNVSWSPEAVANNYPVQIAAGDGIYNVYLSRDGSATSGSPSGTEFPFGSTVYAFAQLNRSILSAITVPSNWVRVDSSDLLIYRVDSKQLNPSWNRNFGTINATLASYAVTIAASEGINSVFLSTNPNALSGSPSGTKFKSTTTVYAFAAVHQNYVYRVPSSWTKIGTSGTSTVYRVGSTYVATSAYNFGTITLPVAYTVTVSCDRTGGLSKAYLSTSSTATSGSTSLNVASGTTVYGFAVLNSYKSADQFTGWNLISGTANTPGAIYRVGSKKITANTTYYINLFEESDDSSVIFKRSGENAGSWTVKNHEIQSASGSSKIYQSGTSIYARYDDYNGSMHDILLGTFNCPSGYIVTFTLSNYAGNRISLGSSVNLGGPGPYTVMAWVEPEETVTS